MSYPNQILLPENQSQYIQKYAYPSEKRKNESKKEAAIKWQKLYRIQQREKITRRRQQN